MSNLLLLPLAVIVSVVGLIGFVLKRSLTKPPIEHQQDLPIRGIKPRRA